jgi:hypothetical protein
MSRANAIRRNRAACKIRASRHLSPEIKLTVEAILDLLNRDTGYSLAWPSAAALAKRTGKSRRTVLWHIKVVKELGIFKVHRFSPQGAKAFVQKKYGIEINLERCRCQAPNLFEVNIDHPLWDKSTTVPPEVDDNWRMIVQRINALRNAKSTGRLATTQERTPTLPSEVSHSFSCSDLSTCFPNRVNGVARDPGGLPRRSVRR